MTNTPRNFCLSMRCSKRIIRYGNKSFDVYEIKDSPARSVYGKIFLDKTFFEYHTTEQEQLAALYHEEYHQNHSTTTNKFFNTIRLLSFKKANWEEEFSADRYAAINTNKKAVISFLNKAKQLYADHSITYDPKSHPTVEERIKRIEMLKTD